LRRDPDDPTNRVYTRQTESDLTATLTGDLTGAEAIRALGA
jgi:hypothetical protein